MRGIVMGLVLTLFAGVAMAQEPAAPEKTFASAADVMALIPKAKSEIKPDQPMFNQSVLHLAPYNLSLEYRRGVAPAQIHENQAELFYVVEGSGTITTGGKLVNEKRIGPTNLTGTAIEGGTSTPMKKGDWLIVPENTPHWWNQINGAVILMSLHVPRPVPGK